MPIKNTQMKKLPQITIDPDPLFKIQQGAIQAQVLMTAVELKVFNHTTSAVTGAEVAAAIGTHAVNTELFLNVLCSMELLQKSDGTFVNTPLSDTFLVKGEETWLGDFLQMNDGWMFQNRQQMQERLINGPAAPQQSSDPAEESEGEEMFQSDFIRISRNFARSGIAQGIAEELSKLPEFNGFQKMLDLGGAHGMDCMATVQKHPSLVGTVFDQSHVIHITGEIIDEYGMGDRVSVIGGDCMADPLGDDYDLILAKGMLNFTGPALGDVIKKIYTSLSEGGVFVSIHEGLTRERTQPADTVISWLPTALNVMDVGLEKRVIPTAMEQAGFRNIESKPYHFPMGGSLEMTVGRK